MKSLDSALTAGGGDVVVVPDGAALDRKRLRVMAKEHFQFIWRCLRRLGVPGESVDDATQRVFEIATAKLQVIRPGSERAFLFHTAIRVAASTRRRAGSWRETPDEELLANEIDPAPLPDDATEWKRRREMLQEILYAMPMDLRAVFVLFELEGMSTAEIAVLFGIPPGTVASRLRRAREDFHQAAKRLRARLHLSGGER